MPEKALIPVKTKEKMEKALEFFNSLKTVSFKNDQEYENGVELCKSIKKHINEIEADRKVLVKPLNDDLNFINGECNGTIRKLQNGEKVIKKGMADYFQEKERKRIEDQKKRDAEVEKKRKQELEKANKELEKEQKYREEGRDDLADNARARAETSSSVAETLTSSIAENTAKVSGTSFKKKLTISIEDKKAAIESMIINDILFQFVSIDEKGLEKFINAAKIKIEIPGVRIIEDISVGIRTK